LFALLFSDRHCLDAVVFDNLQDLEAEEFEQQEEEEDKCP
jgi:hypothetical protein